MTTRARENDEGGAGRGDGTGRPLPGAGRGPEADADAGSQPGPSPSETSASFASDEAAPDFSVPGTAARGVAAWTPPFEGTHCRPVTVHEDGRVEPLLPPPTGAAEPDRVDTGRSDGSDPGEQGVASTGTASAEPAIPAKTADTAAPERPAARAAERDAEQTSAEAAARPSVRQVLGRDLPPGPVEHLAPAHPLTPALHPIPGHELNAPAGIPSSAAAVPVVPAAPVESASPDEARHVPPSTPAALPAATASASPSAWTAPAASPTTPHARTADDDDAGARDADGGADARAAGVQGAGVQAAGETVRWNSPLIVGESTHEIPVHLLFRDETGPARPAAGARRMRRVPAPAPVPVVPVRAAPPSDPKLVERPGPVLPGWVAALAGLVAVAACAAVVWWAGAVPDAVNAMLRLPSPAYHGITIAEWALLALGVTVALFAFGGLGRGRVGQAWVLTLFGDYRGSVRRTGLLWVSPLLLRRKVDVRLRHWRSEPVPAVDANGTALRVVVLVVWRVRDTVRAALGVRDHEEYLREQVEAAMARVLSQLPADAFHDEAPTLRNAEAVGDALTRMLSAECRPVGVEVFSAQPTRIEYAPEIAEAMQRSRIAAIDARHRDSVLTAVVDAVDDTVHRLTSRGLVELDDYERKALVKDLTVAFYTGRQGTGERF
ncbi:SPFH domain-containing protein [Streptomyces liangshanensis]|uniref:Membrane protease subunit n=1 Tax=Streptomyces liangshanensis TaxID=2717324 RepID=A0A6G9H368_9ACTN|nr:SPFH domain-containing protein [Streptomyces liangshanensis]QIQ04671.1 membrane protease subunit [Streptomyces liangshanensis]